MPQVLLLLLEFGIIIWCLKKVSSGSIHKVQIIIMLIIQNKQAKNKPKQKKYTCNLHHI